MKPPRIPAATEAHLLASGWVRRDGRWVRPEHDRPRGDVFAGGTERN